MGADSFEEVGEKLYSSFSDEGGVETEESENEEVVEPTDENTEETVGKTEEKPENTKESTTKQDEKQVDKKEELTKKETGMSKEEIEKLKQDLFKDLQTSLTKDQGKADKTSEDKVESEDDDIKNEAQGYLDMDEEELRDAFFEDPKKVVDSIVAERLNEELAKERQKYEPVVKEYALNKTKQKMQETVNNFAKEHEDFEQHSENIAKILREDDLDMSNEKSLEYAYYKAKSMGKEQVDASRKTLDEFVDDEDALKQLTSNDKLKNMIIEQYVKEVANGKRDPATITDETGESPMTNNKKEKSFDDISESLYRKLK